MPADQTLGSHPRARRAANEEGLLALGAAIERRIAVPRSRTHRRRHVRSARRIWIRRGVFAVCGLVVVVILAGVADYLYLGSLINYRHLNHLQTDGNGLNILLVGSTDRCSLKQQNPMYGYCDAGVNGINSDIVMVAHLQNGKASLLSIPRDLFVPNARVGVDPGVSANKIDASLVDGPSQLAAVVEEDFGIPINHYIELNFDTFADVVNAVGGIDMYFPVRVYDAESSLNIERPGCYHLDGLHALEVVRARHLQIGFPSAGNDPVYWPQEAQSDLARIRRTHEFLRIVAAKIAKIGISPTDQSLAVKVLPDLVVDQNFSEPSMVSLAVSYLGTDIATVPEYTYPVVLNQADPANADSYLYQGYYYGDVEFPVNPGGWLAIDSIFGAKPDQSPWDDKVLPVAGSFPMSVVNGTGVYHQATIIGHALDAKGFHVTATGDATPYGPTSETVVWYGGPPPPKNGNWHDPDQADAMRVMTELQGPVTLGYDPSQVTRGDAVTVLTGTDVSIATKDWTSTTTTPTSTSSTTTTTTLHKKKAGKPKVTATTVYDPPGVRTDPNFSAPSALAQPLEPWDPRACTASMKVLEQK